MILPDLATMRASWRDWLANDLRDPRGPVWLQWTWTLLLCLGIAAGITLFSLPVALRRGDMMQALTWLARFLLLNAIVCLTIGVFIHAINEGLRQWLRRRTDMARWTSAQRTAYRIGPGLVGVLLGLPTGAWLAGFDVPSWLDTANGQRFLAGSLVFALALNYAVGHHFAVRAREMDAERRATEAQLRLLQGQIEPHFLFNTLAGVVSLIDENPSRARAMLVDFTDYLRASLSSLRRDEVPLDDELSLAAHYLSLMQARMEDRLAWTFDIDPAARAVPVPPLLLQPLVENAVRHGLEPTARGGTVRVRARVQEGRLTLEVHDDGRGPKTGTDTGTDTDTGTGLATDAISCTGATAGTGMALDNLRTRLEARHGAAARIEVHAAQPGTQVVVSLPLPPP